MLLHEEVYWKQRAKLFWLKNGDANTKFFHAQATRRKKLNNIRFLVIEEGERVDDHDRMCAMTNEYFTGVFSDVNTRNVRYPT